MKPIRISLLVGIFLALLCLFLFSGDGISFQRRNEPVQRRTEPDKYFWKTATSKYLRWVDFWNHLTPASEKQALDKLKRMRDAARPVTVDEFLGDKVTSFQLRLWRDHFSAGTAIELVQEVLHSVIIMPGHESGPVLEEYSAQARSSRVEAVLKYKNGSEGILLIDWDILLVQDCDGVYWWCPLSKPGEVLSESGHVGQPETNRLPSAAGSPR